MSEFIQLSFLMCVAHFLCDYPLQGDWLAKAKNPMLTPVEGESIWKVAMSGHCAVHAAAVYILTGVWWLAVIEFVTHFFTDVNKCDGTLTYSTDQTIHLTLKIIYAAIVVVWRLA